MKKLMFSVAILTFAGITAISANNHISPVNQSSFATDTTTVPTDTTTTPKDTASTPAPTPDTTSKT